MSLDYAWIAFALAIFPAALGAINLRLVRGPQGAVPDGALVSILIPARDEATNIEGCLAAALAQQGVAIEVVVMDDGSTDGTPDIVRRIAAADPRVRLVEAPALPEGWSGKMHACARLAEAARGTHFLFIDADVRLEPRAAAALSGHMARQRLGLVSGVPRQVMLTWGEGVTVPMINLLLVGYLPGGGRAFTRHPGFAAGCGQMMMFERGAYEAVGGHGALRTTLHDGLKFARLLRARGHRTEIVEGSGVATCRMYRDFAEAWRGFLKNAREGMATPVGLPVWTVVLAGAHLWPFFLLPAWQAAIALAMVFGLRMAITRRAREPSWTILLHPVAVLVALAIQWTALVRFLMGRKEGWKGRAYAAPEAT
ncbi:glycosyltransferase [Roseomonas sp. PWR1]|uniref:Glycosyltransferase n=1 Tax=Roseomonas nitratireducens TaxID=2820810 RepID=A0ABS4AMS7_9PROT|nr:glycosyltransferase [Neoroseomonas nitratireducens]